MAVDYMETLDKMYAKCSTWHSLPKSDIDEYLTYTLYSFSNVRPYEKAERIVAEWKRKRASEKDGRA